MKKIIVFLLSAFIFMNVYSIDSNVYDYALLLSKKEEEKLNKEIEKYKKINNQDVVIVTIKQTNYEYKEYIEKFVNKNSYSNNINIIVYDFSKNKYFIFANENKYYTKNNINSFLEEVDGNKDCYLIFNKFLHNNKNYTMLSTKNIITIIFISIILTVITLLLLIKSKIYKKNITNQNELDIKYIHEKFISTSTKNIKKARKK